MSVAIEFPGTAVTATGSANNAGFTVTLPAPAAGFLQYLDKFIITSGTAAASAISFVAIQSIAGGNISFDLISQTTAGIYISETFPAGWPASATATAISIQLGAGIGSQVRISLFGHNVPV